MAGGVWRHHIDGLRGQCGLSWRQTKSEDREMPKPDSSLKKSLHGRQTQSCVACINRLCCICFRIWIALMKRGVLLYLLPLQKDIHANFWIRLIFCLFYFIFFYFLFFYFLFLFFFIYLFIFFFLDKSIIILNCLRCMALHYQH